jgi:hypothetical protein
MNFGDFISKPQTSLNIRISQDCNCNVARISASLQKHLKNKFKKNSWSGREEYISTRMSPLKHEGKLKTEIQEEMKEQGRRHVAAPQILCN